MTFDSVIPIIGNDFRGEYKAPYRAQIPILLDVKYSLSTTVSRTYLRWTLYWYERRPGEATPTRKYKRYEWINLESSKVWDDYVELLESELNLDYLAEPITILQPKDFQLLVEIFNYVTETKVESAVYDFDIGGRHKYAVDWTFPQFTPYSDITYPIIGESDLDNKLVSTYNSRDSGTPLVWESQYDKIEAGKWCKLMLIVVGMYDNEPIDLDVAVSRGYISENWRITDNSIHITYDYFPPFGYQLAYQLNGGFKAAGDYKLVFAYYEKNDTEYPGYYTLRTMESSQFRIYKPFSGANMHISSIIPAEYKEGDTDPLNGMPPYVVTVADDTVRDELTVPLSSITIEWGDPDSGVSNAWSILEPGTDSITIPPHTYEGYGPYNILMTCVDKRGGTTTKSIQFAPSKVPRVMKNPRINGVQPGTAVTGTQPLLVSCESFVGGLPLPDVKWSFALQGGDPDYYSGEKEGQYAELSLLAAGTYSVTCEITNSGTVIQSSSWTVTVTPTTIYQDTPIPANDYDVWVCDGGERVDYIVPIRCQVILRHAHSSYCEFDIPINHKSLNLLQPDGEIIVGCDGKARLMRITEFAESSDGLYVTITAIDAASSALSSRVATLATNSTSGNGYDIQTCSAEALMRYFAISNIRSGNRVIPRMRVVDTNADRGGRVTYSARYESIIDIIEDICSQTGLGWDSSLQTDSPQTFSFKVVAGVDRTSSSNTPVIFTARSLGSARLGSYTSLSGSNVAIAAGKGTGDTRQYSEFGETTESDLSRKEVFVDAGDAADDDEVECTAKVELARQDEQSISVYPNNTVYKYGVDYQLGDYVTVVTLSGLSIDVQIIQATFSKDETGETLTLECGTDMRSYQRVLQQQKLANTYSRK